MTIRTEDPLSRTPYPGPPNPQPDDKGHPNGRIEGDSTHKNTAKVLASHSTRKMAVTSHNFHDSSLNGGEMI